MLAADQLPDEVESSPGKGVARAADPRDEEALLRRFEASSRRSHERRASTGVRDHFKRRYAAVAVTATLVGGLVVEAPQMSDAGRPPREDATRLAALGEIGAEARRPGRTGQDKVPTAAALRRAWSYARDRGGLVSVAVVDTAGNLRGRAEERRYVSASVVKALLLAAELARLEEAGLPLDEATAQTLRAMVTYSDNAAADAIYSRVGDPGLVDVARRAGMGSFSVEGYWANAEITAADMARFFYRLDAQMSGPHREFALGLLGSVIPEQRWGLAAAAGDDWSVRLKGGWRGTDRGQLVHQAAELRAGDRRLSLVVLSDAQPSHGYAVATLRGIAERLLGRR